MFSASSVRDASSVCGLYDKCHFLSGKNTYPRSIQVRRQYADEQNKKFPSPEMLERIAEALEVDSPQLFSMETYSQTVINQFKENLKVNLEKAIDDFIDKGLNEVEILGVNVFLGEKKE